MAHIPKTPSEKKLQELLRLKAQLEQDAVEQERVLDTLKTTRECAERCVYPDVCTKRSCILHELSRRVEEASVLDRIIDRVFSTREQQSRRRAELQTLWKIRKSRYYQLSHEPVLQSIRNQKGGYQQWEKSSNDRRIRVNPRPERQLMRQLNIGPAESLSPPSPPTGKK